MKIGPYELLELIGKGGMGSVYRCYHQDTGRVLAIKVMAAEMTANLLLLRRFEQECAAALRLKHPYIVEGVDFGVAEGRPFLAMELIEGESLAARIDRGPLPEPVALHVATQIAQALQAAHAANLVHRDVKPENILLTRDGTAMLADLGLVKDLDGEELTRSGAWVGTIAYMAPEQFGDARNVDGRCDIYALAATIYHALTGSTPFPQKGALTILGKKLANEFDPPQRLLPSLSAATNAALCRALDADPARRPATCEAPLALLAAPTEAPAVVADPERRGGRRFPTASFARISPLSGGTQTWQARIDDVSSTGVRLQAARRFEPSAVVQVRVSHGEDIAVYMARVKWVRQASAEAWDIGCSFARPLAESDLDAFLDGRPQTIVTPPAE